MAEDNADDNGSRDKAGPRQDGLTGPPRVPDRRADGGASRYRRSGDTPLRLAGRVLRWRALNDRFSRDFMRRTLRIGVSARIYHPEPDAVGLRS
jgi:putative glutamine amidotransferase